MISNSEWEIMKVVYANESVNAQFIWQIVKEKMDWSLSTVKTLLSRLVSKGYLATQQNGRTFYYKTTKPHKQLVLENVENALQQICTKEIGEMIGYLIENYELSKTDCYTLQEKLTETLLKAPDDVACCCAIGQCKCHS